MSLAASKRAGERSESAAIEVLPWLRYVNDETAEHYDAVVREDTDELSADDVVEIKSAAVVLADERPGMWYLRKGQHDRLVADEGWYLLVVSAPQADRQVLAHQFVRAAAFEAAHLDGWWDGGERADFRQVRWTAVFEQADLTEGTQ